MKPKSEYLNIVLAVFIGLLLSGTGLNAAPAGAEVEQTDYQGWRSYKLSNGLITMHIVPDIGGRIIQYELGDHPFLFVNPALAGRVFPPEENGGGKGGWKNYGGSKLWPAPQGWQRDDQWPGPPDPVLDGGVYRGEITHRDRALVTVKVTSLPDDRTGVQLSRSISLSAGTTQVHHDCAIKNIGLRPVRWSIWEVIQQNAAAPDDPARFNDDLWAFCPLNPHSAHPNGYFPMFGQVTHASWRPDYAHNLLAVKYDYRVGKVGLDSSAGWFAVVNGRSEHCFVGKFQWFPNAPYPDHASVEFWLNGAGEFILNGTTLTNAADPKETPYLMETEILSPLVQLEPGQEHHFQIDWFATRCPKPVLDVTAAGAIHQPLTILTAERRLLLQGVFGVFTPGQAEAVVSDALGNVLLRVNLGAVHPTKVFRLRHDVAAPAGATRVSVRVLDGEGQNRGWLGNAPVPGPGQ